MQVLHQHKYVEEGKRNNNTSSGTSSSSSSSTKIKGKYVSLSPQSVTQEGWSAAEAHLREALKTAIENPRGKSIHAGGGGGSGTKKQQSKKKKSKKQQLQEQKKRLQQKSSNEESEGNIVNTLSAASAAQNLAVFLKSKAMTVQEENSDEKLEMLQEAKKLYHQVKRVRSQLLPEQHPDLYATNYSLAELLDVMDDEEAANTLRQEIIDTYDPPAEGNDDNGGEEEESSSLSSSDVENDEKEDADDGIKKVIVEKTVADKV